MDKLRMFEWKYFVLCSEMKQPFASSIARLYHTLLFTGHVNQAAGSHAPTTNWTEPLYVC